MDPEYQLRFYHEVQQLPSELAKDVADTILAELFSLGRSPLLERLQAPSGYERTPISMKQFLEDPYYMGSVENLRAVVKQDLIDLFDGDYIEAAIDGSIGWGKSVFVSFAFAYMIYQISCLKDPQQFYHATTGSAIYLVNQSVTETLAKKVVFGEILARIKASPFFQKEFPPEPNITSELRFPKNIQVLPVASTDTSAIGLNVFAGAIDEVNFMHVIKGSTRARGQEQFYDAPAKLYNAILRRLETRFMRLGKIPGKVIVISSSQYPDDFTERKKEEAKTNPKIFVRSHSLWEANPDAFSGEKFKVEIGGKYGRSRILTGDESEDEIQGQIIEFPVEFRGDCEKDLDGAIRDIAGKATLSIDPFMPDVDRLREAIDLRRQHPFSAPVTTLQDAVRLIPNRLAVFENDEWKPKHYPTARRVMHIDYAVSNDECGVCMSCAPKSIEVTRRDSEGNEYQEKAPFIHVDFMLKIVPPIGGEIDLEKVRSVLVHGMRKYGFRIRVVNFDSFQSVEARQSLKKHGIESEILSVDTDMGPYLELKSAHNEKRISMYEYEPYIEEAIRLRIDREKRKVDHPPRWDKGVTDAVAGCVAQCVEDFRGGVDEMRPVIHKGKTDEELDVTGIEKETFIDQVKQISTAHALTAISEGHQADWEKLPEEERERLGQQLKKLAHECNVIGDRETAKFYKSELERAQTNGWV